MTDRISTGIQGLDDILGGGLPPNRFFLVQGDPGVGKTTLGLQFLLEGQKRGEAVLYISLSETRDELSAVAVSHGWDISKMPVFEMSGETVRLEEQNTLFEPSEVELAELTRKLVAQFERVKPARLVFDSLSEMRLLAQSALRYRRQILALKQYFAGRGCTVLLMDDCSGEAADAQLQSLAHGVIILEQLSPIYGAERRRLRVAKVRGVQFRGGFHDYVIHKGGIRVFPRLVAADHRTGFEGGGRVPSGVEQLDALLGGGLDRGTSALLVGPAGSGKSVMAMQYAWASVKRNEPAIVYAFDEGLGTLMARCTALGMPLDGPLRSGLLRIQQVDPAEMSPGQFAHVIRADVGERGARVVIIDSMNGYLAAMPEEQFLTVQVHELLSYLRQLGVLVILVVAQAGLFGAATSPVDLSYLADSVILFRFFEAGGMVRKAISVLKRRSGGHATDIRELTLGVGGMKVGEQLRGLHGVLTGLPRRESEA